MIRDRDEVKAYRAEKVRTRMTERPLLPLHQPSFETLQAQEAGRWSTIASAEALQAEASRIRLELSPSDYARFIHYACVNFGIGLVRAAGLPIPPLHLAH